MTETQPKVLCIDDQQDILLLLQRQLENHYDCRFATSAVEGLGLLPEGPFAVVVVDYTMPDMDGITFLQEMKSRSKDTVSVMLTAKADLEIAIDALHQGQIYRFLTKPWDAASLRNSIDDAIAHYQVIASERRLAKELATAYANLSQKVSKLQEINGLLQHWVEFSPAVIYSTRCKDGNFTPRYVSKNFLDLAGYDRAEMIANPMFWFEHLHPQDRPQVVAEIESAIATQQHNHVAEYRFRHRSGEYRWIHDSFRAVPSTFHGETDLIGAWLDVTGQRQVN